MVSLGHHSGAAGGSALFTHAPCEFTTSEAHMVERITPEAMPPARKAYEEATAPAWKAYEEAMAPRSAK